MSEKRGIDMKSNFYILFKTYRDKQLIKQQQQLAKQTENYDGKFQPLLKFNEFNDEEKAELKRIRREKNEKRCRTRSKMLKNKKK